MKESEGIRIEPIGLGSSIHNKALTFQEHAYLNFRTAFSKGRFTTILNLHPTNSIFKGQIHHLTFVSNLRDLHSNPLHLQFQITSV